MDNLVISIHRKNLKTSSSSRRATSEGVVLEVAPCSMEEEWLRRISTKLRQMPLPGNPVITVAPNLATNCQPMLSTRPKVFSKKWAAIEKHSIEIFSLNTTSSAPKSRPSSKSLRWLWARLISTKITLTRWSRSRYSSSSTMCRSLLDRQRRRLPDARQALSVMSMEIGSRVRLAISRGKTVHLVVAQVDLINSNNSPESLVKVSSNHLIKNSRQHHWRTAVVRVLESSWDQTFPTAQASTALSPLLKYNSMPQVTLPAATSSNCKVLQISSQGSLTTMSCLINSSQ